MTQNKPIFQKKKCCLISKKTSFIPGIIRLRDAPYYLGMNKIFFRDSVQPYLTRIPIDKRGIGFNRHELDCWIAYMQATLGQQPQKVPPWENPTQTTPIQIKSTYPSRFAPRVTKKKPSQEKPTFADLENLIEKTIPSDKSH